MVNAAPVPYALKQEVVARLGEGFLYEIYGSTELGIATVLRPEDQLRKPGLVRAGLRERRAAGGRTRTGSTQPAGVPGEVFIRSPNAMVGYHGSTEQLAELPGGWKSVGDVGWLDGEGYLHICDRRTDMVITGGMNVYPAEVEAALHAHADVADAAVFGVADDEWGERVHAVVAPRAGRTVDPAALGRVPVGAAGRVQAAEVVVGPRRAAPDRERQAAQAGAAGRARRWCPDEGAGLLLAVGPAAAGRRRRRPGDAGAGTCAPRHAGLQHAAGAGAAVPVRGRDPSAERPRPDHDRPGLRGGSRPVLPGRRRPRRRARPLLPPAVAGPDPGVHPQAADHRRRPGPARPRPTGSPPTSGPAPRRRPTARWATST